MSTLIAATNSGFPDFNNACKRLTCRSVTIAMVILPPVLEDDHEKSTRVGGGIVIVARTSWATTVLPFLEDHREEKSARLSGDL